METDSESEQIGKSDEKQKQNTKLHSQRICMLLLLLCAAFIHFHAFELPIFV